MGDGDTLGVSKLESDHIIIEIRYDEPSGWVEVVRF